MKAARNILSLILVLTVISAGLPLYHPADINRDNAVDLKDAIIRAQAFERSADDPAAFVESVRDVVSTLYIVAGLKKVIKSERTANSTGTAPSLQNQYIISSYHFSVASVMTGAVTESCFHYQSVDLSPASPPPRPVHVSQTSFALSEV
jgi:hypothetical protein